MVIINFTSNKVWVMVEGKLFALYPTDEKIYDKLHNDILDSDYDKYMVTHYEQEKFSCNTWEELDEFLASYCNA